MQGLRSAIFYLGLVVPTVAFALLAIIIWPLPLRVRQPIISRWSVFALYWLRLTCGVDWRIHGMEKLNGPPAVILCKHQSAWETIALCGLFPPQVWVLKRELFFVPAFGQALAALAPIAISRGQGSKALRQVITQGVDRIRRGMWVVIFPEGTRVAPGASGRYARSGAQLAVAAGCQVFPVAHNAGLCWPRSSFIKQAGMIDVIVGDPIDSTGLSAAEITRRCESWIESTSRSLLPAGHHGSDVQADSESQ
ncbi:MAG: 1-acyl-sn-glycerol-3-phosphate acyltransferase [Gammaproteobacteria bacterium]|nr:1-acyl-sn-glycerol-3-phosphate acyltransferase [Gammaproteobacteria bacterium]